MAPCRTPLCKLLTSESPSQDGQDDGQSYQGACYANQQPRKAFDSLGTLPKQEALGRERDLPLRDDWSRCPGTVFLNIVFRPLKKRLKEGLYELYSPFLLVFKNGLGLDRGTA